MHYRQRPINSSVFSRDPLYSANEFVEEQNDKAENELHDKVGLLRSLSINIGEEVRGHNHLLKETDDKFDSLGGLVSTTIGKVKLLGNSGHRYYSLYLLLFCFFVFIVIWWIV